MATMTFPNWAEFTPEKAAAELPRELAAAEKAIAEIEKSEPKTFEELEWRTSDATRPLMETWGNVSHMTSVMNTEAWRKVEEDFQPQLVQFSLRMGQSKRLYELTRRLAAAESDPTRSRILKRELQGFEHSGVALEGERKERFNEIAAKLAKLSMDFANAVLDATKAFKFEKDGKTYTIDDANYPETMKHCPDREVRERLFRARSSRAPENERRIDEILALRRERAKLLGFETPAELSLSTKCAPSVAAVFKMIDDLDAATVKPAAAEDSELENFAKSIVSPATSNQPPATCHLSPATCHLSPATCHLSPATCHLSPATCHLPPATCNLSPATCHLSPATCHQPPATCHLSPATCNLSPLAPWDRAFAAERLREKKYAYSEDELKRHFEMEKVVAGLFRMVKFLFDVDIVEVKGAEKPSVWHRDVRFYRVVENGRTIAYFYFDPFVRNGLKQGGAWQNEFRNRCDRLGQLPVAIVVTNFPEPDRDGHCYLPMREVETIFHEFGHATQCMLTRIGEEGAAGISLVEWDAVEVASQFLENWCLDDRTGIVIPAELKRKVLAAKNYRAASACRRQLAFAKTDMLLHSNPSNLSNSSNPSSLSNPSNARLSPDEVKRRMFDHFGLPVVPEDKFLCAFTHIFAGGYAAGYYGYKWAEVMSADCYGAFEEAGLKDDAAVKRVGRKYRDTVLALGGSKSALDVFREFRGRNPEIGAILRQQGLK